MGSCEFAVTVKRKEVVASVLPLQEHWLPLSNLDLLLPSVDVGVFFCYREPNKGEEFTFATVVSVLKTALAKALVSYYAFAGEIVPNLSGEPEIFCNNRGVDFFEAYADVELRDLDLYNPDASVTGKLVPEKKDGVLSVQVTELECGGVVVACTFDHRIADAYSANMFLVAWAEIAQAKNTSPPPSFRRSLLNPRRPGFYDASLNDMYVTISSLPPPTAPEPGADHIISRIYYVKSEDMNRLQSQASSNGYRRSKLEAFSAFLWQIVAKGAGDNAKGCKMGIVVDGRSRLSDEEGDHKASLMATYFGNVLSIPFGEGSIDELTTKPLCWVADAVHEFLGSAVTKEHFLGLIDWVEAHRPEPALAKIYCKGREDGAAFVVSSGQRFPVRKVDFGWGKPAFGSYHFPWGGESGYVMPMPSATEDGDWVVYMHLFKGHLELLETQAAHVFRPLTSDYINFNCP
ncbi:hypothetical protein HHK36_021030 [Tetracentron sinense]|uniref:Uncharacterized protein n=1 Tax=Tetracentron sinense TaxID=13715 RepID=A0A835D6P9_TETSI|nr:hypothetical protein HHK36_021030 [Tetracentron sinense]